MAELNPTLRPVKLTFLRQGAAGVLQLLNVVVIARFAGVVDTGHFTLAVSVAQLVSLFLGMGIAPALVHYVARGEIAPRQAISLSVKTAIAVTLLCWLTLSGLLIFNDALLPSVSNEAVIPLFFAVAALAANSYLLAVLQGMQDFGGYNIGLVTPPILTVSVTVFIAVYGDVTGTIAVWVWAIAHLVTLPIILARTRARGIAASSGAAESSNRESLTKLIRFGWRAHIANASSFLIYRTDILLINWFLGPAAVGAYSIAVHIAEKTWMISTSVTTVFFPKISKGTADLKQKRTVSEAVVIAAQAVFFITLIVAIVLSIFADWGIGAFFGVEFLPAVIPLQVLLISAALFGAARVFSVAVTASGYPTIAMYVAGTLLVINILGNIVLIPHWGIIGAAVSTAATYLLATIANATAFVKIFSHPASTLFNASTFFRLGVRSLFGRGAPEGRTTNQK